MQTTASTEQGSASWHSGSLPQSSIDFTIPSIHDGVILECRLYHPRKSRKSASYPEIKAVTIAHPYAPLGGSFDDHVVHAAGREFLSQGYVLGLFNLRGAGGSKGHTSWSSKPEQDDYVSFVGFLACYMRGLQHFHTSKSKPQAENQNLSVQDTPSLVHHGIDIQDRLNHSISDEDLTLVLGGYSYGSHIVRHLPDIASILNLFTKSIPGTAASEIQLRAMEVARKRVQEQEQNTSRSTNYAAKLSFEDAHSRELGNDETQRFAQKPRKTFEKLRKSMDKPRARFTKQRDTTDHHEPKEDTLLDSRNSPSLKVRYLLISPLLPPVSAFLALSIHWGRADPAPQERLKNHECLAVWGSNDIFTSSKKLNKWARGMVEAPDSMFQYTELSEIGHFWLEHDAETKLRHRLRSWIQRCDSQ